MTYTKVSNEDMLEYYSSELARIALWAHASRHPVKPLGMFGPVEEWDSSFAKVACEALALVGMEDVDERDWQFFSNWERGDNAHTVLVEDSQIIGTISDNGNGLCFDDTIIIEDTPEPGDFAWVDANTCEAFVYTLPVDPRDEEDGDG